jgi:acetyl esterase/lipase
VVPERGGEEERVISVLRETAAATIARINYRASPLHQYPTPFHDVLFGWDWIRENLLVDEFQRPYLARLGVCGELIGGSLAAMLALTECRLGESRVAAAAVNNPIADWVFPDELPVVDPSELPEPMAPDETAFPADEDIMGSLQVPEKKPRGRPRKRSPKAPSLTAWQRYGENNIIPALTLSAERDVLFRRPQDYLDRFASPIHFFRSPHAQLLLPQQDDMFASRQPDEVLDIEAQMSLDHYNSVNHQASPAPEVPVLSRCRAYARNYPGAGTKLSLPSWTITTGTESPLSDQAAELTKVLRRSIARHALKAHAGRTKWYDATERKMFEEHAKEKILLNETPGVGLWTEHTDDRWKANVQNIATWMKERLDLGNT